MLHSLTTHGVMSMDELPLALLSDILSRVPSEPLLRCRCVCKCWREVVDDPCFRNSVHQAKEPVYLYHEIKKEKIYLLKTREEEATAHEEAMATMQMIEIAQFLGLKDYRLHGACNGLLFFAPITNVRNNPELLINPLTREIRSLPRAPDLSPFASVYGFGFNRSTDTYKMVQINAIGYDEKTGTCPMAARVYDFEKRSWKTCKAPPSSRDVHPYFVFASGALNWFLLDNSLPSPWTRATLSFDLTGEEFSLIPLPDDFSRSGTPTVQWQSGRMHQLGGSLALVHHSNRMHIDVWVLKDYISKEWTRKYRVDTLEAPCPDGLDGGNYFVIGLHKRDKLILRHIGDKQLYVYDVDRKRFTRYRTKEEIAIRCYALFWCETLSLVSLERHGDVARTLIRAPFQGHF
ncbi:hypothetical protein NL676_001281 [Syzygium grande]|nr:hypothetical protein NL676_001281 [Syzygium grande]